jgi:hypothetical protein
MAEAPRTTLALLRRALLVILVLGLIGTGVELVLLEHTDGFWQLAPLGLIGLALGALAWWGVAGGRWSLRALRGTMVLLVASGLVGTWLHYRGNVEFELEMAPALAGLDLFTQAISGATPALAPGAMLHLGLIGLAYAFRHPGRSTPSVSSTDQGAGT